MKKKKEENVPRRGVKKKREKRKNVPRGGKKENSVGDRLGSVSGTRYI